MREAAKRPKVPGSGIKKGQKHASTLEKAAMRALYREKISARFDDIIEAQIASALGVSHMMGKDSNGQWIEVTDPAVMARCLSSGEPFYRITAVNPNVTAIKDVMDRLMDKPAEHVEVTGADGEALVVRWLK